MAALIIKKKCLSHAGEIPKGGVAESEAGVLVSVDEELHHMGLGTVHQHEICPSQGMYACSILLLTVENYTDDVFIGLTIVEIVAAFFT